jgi:GNAT superfamily N-acetyltransferase
MSILRVRPATFDDRFALARIIIDATFSAFHGRVPDKCLRWLEVEESAENWGRTIETLPKDEHLLVANVSGLDVVGLILAGRSTEQFVRDPDIAKRYRIDLTSLQITPAWQGKGIGAKLIRAASEKMIADGGVNLLVRVLRDNPNVTFYERLGAHAVGCQPYDWEGYETYEDILAWENMPCLT